MNIFAYTDRPDESIIYKRDDPNDWRLGDVVPTDPGDYDNANFVIIGCPQDEGVERNQGRVGAASGPDAIRRAFYKLVDFGDPAPDLFDLGNTRIQAVLENTHEIHRQIVRKLVEDGKTVISLGGGNDISFPDCAGLSQAIDAPIMAFNIDAHFDVRSSSVPNSGTPYRQLLEGGFVAPLHFFELGYQPFSNSVAYRRYLKGLRVQYHSLEEWRAAGIETLLTQILQDHTEPEAIFWGLDMDVVKDIDAPGVSAPNALGMRAEEFCTIAYLAGRQPRSRILEISELNPYYDIDHRTARLAATAIYHFLQGWQEQQL